MKMVMSPRGQVTLPKAFRKAVGLLPGDEIRLTRIGDDWVLKPKTLTVDDIAGFLGPPPNGRPLSIEEMDEAIGEAVAEDYRKSVKRD